VAQLTDKIFTGYISTLETTWASFPNFVTWLLFHFTTVKFATKLGSFTAIIHCWWPSCRWPVCF